MGVVANHCDMRNVAKGAVLSNLSPWLSNSIHRVQDSSWTAQHSTSAVVHSKGGSPHWNTLGQISISRFGATEEVELAPELVRG